MGGMWGVHRCCCQFIIPEGLKYIGLHQVVAAGAPSVSLAPTIAIAAPLRVKVWPPSTKVVDEGPRWAEERWSCVAQRLRGQGI